MVNTKLSPKRSINRVAPCVYMDLLVSSCMTDASITEDGSMTKSWSNEHAGKGWQDANHRVAKECDRDEYPPA